MSREGCAPDDVFDKYCAELSVPRLITTWSIEMSKQQLMDTLSNRGYRFELNRFSVDQLLQLLRESDVLYHQVRKQGVDYDREPNRTAFVTNEKSKGPEQHKQYLHSETRKVQVQPGINMNPSRADFEFRGEDMASTARESERSSQDVLGRQARAENLLVERFGQHAPGEPQEGANRGKRKSEADDEEGLESKMEQERKKKIKDKQIDSEFQQRVDALQTRLLGVAIKSGTHHDITVKVRRLEGQYFGAYGLMTDVLKDIKKHTTEKWDKMEMKRSWGVRLVPEAVEKMKEAKTEISEIEALLAQLE